LIFLCDIVTLKPTIVLIISHLLTSVKFREIPRQYQNSMEKGEFRSSARNSTARRKLWALVMTQLLANWISTFSMLLYLAPSVYEHKSCTWKYIHIYAQATHWIFQYQVY